MKVDRQAAGNWQRTGLVEKFWFTLFVVCLMTFVFEGLLRYALASVGLGALLYLRDVVAIVFIVMVVANGLLLRGWLEPIPAFLISLLGFHFVVGVVQSVEISQALFGFKIFLPMLFAACIFPMLQDRYTQLAVVMRLILLASVLGVLSNWWFGTMPWEGLVYDTGFGTVRAAMQWWTEGGEARLPGFARTSYDAAIIIGLSGMWVLLTTRSMWAVSLVAAVCLVVIDLTTCKGMLMAFAVLCLWLFGRKTTAASGDGSWLYVAMSIIAFVVPALVVAYDVQDLVYRHDLSPRLLSLFARFDDMWPRAMHLMVSPLSPLVGQGLGSIGAAQLFAGETESIQNAGDNIFVYAYVTFGALGVIYLFALVVHAYSRRASGDTWKDYRTGTLILAFTYGLTTNVVESTFFLPFLGFLVGEAFNAGAGKGSVGRVGLGRVPA